MTKPDYRYLLVDTSTGIALGEMAYTPTAPFTRTLNDAGSGSGTVPRDDPLATLDSLSGDREIVVLRNEVPVWNGPLVTISGSLSSDVVTLGFREPLWYLSKRVLEMDKNYATDLYNIVRDLVTYATTKESNGLTSGGTSINAALPRFTVSPAAGTLAGITKTLSFAGSARYVILDLIKDLIADPTTGLDVRMDYSGTRQACQRTLTLGSPSLGTTLSMLITNKVVVELTKEMDRERSASRVHVTGAGAPETLQNTGSVAAGDILLESVFNPSNINASQVVSYAADARRRSQAPVTQYTFTWVPGDNGPLEFDFANLGDTVHIHVTGGVINILHSLQDLRVIQFDIMPPVAGADETVKATLNIPLDELGA